LETLGEKEALLCIARDPFELDGGRSVLTFAS